MTEFAFAADTPLVLPRHNGSMLVIAAVMHLLLFVVVTQVKMTPVRVNSAGTLTAGIAAYVPGPVAVTPAAIVTPKSAPPKKTALNTEVTKSAPKEQQTDTGQTVGSAGVVGTGQSGAGPVRLGTGGNVTLVRRVQPVYPALLQSARVTGQVVLDAIINPDGTIGAITVLKSTNDAFAQSAIQAVKQWRYTAIGFQGILTVSVNFTLT
jgi:TonB family protein